MPVKHAEKVFVAGGYYHAYNRGVEKRDIFLEERDYRTFLWLLREYLLPEHPKDPRQPSRVRRGLGGQVHLLCYCLMPNHFHLLLRQDELDGMTRLMRRVVTSYVTYFNERYGRTGTLFQGKYRAVRVTTDAYLLHLTRYIHRNPDDLGGVNFRSYPYSSYKSYLGVRPELWVETAIILDMFRAPAIGDAEGRGSYRQFVEQFPGQSEAVLGELTLESEVEERPYSGQAKFRVKVRP